MIRRVSILAGGVLIGMLAGMQGAAAFPIVSGPGNGTCTFGPGTASDGDPCTTEAISVHPLWQSNNPLGQGAVWVSYADTGVDGGTLAPPAGSLTNPDGQQYIMEIAETFVLDRYATLDFSIWADDTARLFLDGSERKAPEFGQDVCADQPIGCEPDEFFNLSEVLAPGEHSITMQFYQVGDGTNPGSNPFGGLYSGTVTVPAPGVLALFGVGLLGLFGISRRGARAG